MPPDALTVGVDISKHRLDVHLSPIDLSLSFDNDPDGVAQLVDALRRRTPRRVVVESTGGYEKALVLGLAHARIPVALVNPRPVRDFAKAMGVLAKTDTIDARVLAQFARHVPTRLTQPRDAASEELRQLVARRRQLVDQTTATRNQIEHVTSPAVRASIQRTIAHLQTETAALETLIQDIIDADPRLKSRYDRLIQVRGVGPATARVLVTELPELGAADRKGLTALVGLAPMNDDSGKRHGPRHIRGGRSTVRRALYMAALVASRHNQVIREHYLQLTSRGKPKKVALVACMRKLLAHLNAILRNTQHA